MHKLKFLRHCNELNHKNAKTDFVFKNKNYAKRSFQDNTVYVMF